MNDNILNEVKAALDARRGWPDLEASGSDWVLALSVHLGSVSQAILTNDPERYRRTLVELAASCILATGCLDRCCKPEPEAEPPVASA